eukprot:7848455-Pyramimonas_sp.AAC.2
MMKTYVRICHQYALSFSEPDVRAWHSLVTMHSASNNDSCPRVATSRPRGRVSQGSHKLCGFA